MRTRRLSVLIALAVLACLFTLGCQKVDETLARKYKMTGQIRSVEPNDTFFLVTSVSDQYIQVIGRKSLYTIQTNLLSIQPVKFTDNPSDTILSTVMNNGVLYVLTESGIKKYDLSGKLVSRLTSPAFARGKKFQGSLLPRGDDLLLLDNATGKAYQITTGGKTVKNWFLNPSETGGLTGRAQLDGAGRLYVCSLTFPRILVYDNNFQFVTNVFNSGWNSNMISWAFESFDVFGQNVAFLMTRGEFGVNVVGMDSVSVRKIKTGMIDPQPDILSFKFASKDVFYAVSRDGMTIARFDAVK